MGWRWHGRARRWAAALMWVAASAVASHGAEGPAEWLKLRGDRFDVYSNATVERAGEILRHLESLDSAFAAMAPPGNVTAPLHIPARVQVLFFRDAATYLPFQVASQAPAFFQYGRGRNVVVAHDLGETTLEILSHEYFHVFAHRVGLRLPEWLDEGLAEYYSTLALREGRVFAGAPPARRVAVAGGVPWRAADLFPVTEAAVGGMDPFTKERFYARSWLLAHLLIHHPEWQQGFPRLLERIQQTPTETALREVYGSRFEHLDATLSSYRPRVGDTAVATLAASGAAEPGASAQPRQAMLTPLEMPGWELPLLQADVLALLGRQDAAAAAYATLAERFPEVPAVYESQGQLALERLDLRAAREFFEEAVKHSSSSAEVYHQLATLRCGMQSEEASCLDWIDRSLQGDERQSRDTPKREVILYAVDFALNVRDFPRALRYLARVQARDDEERFPLLTKTAYARYQLADFDGAREALSQAAALSPARRQRKELDDLTRAVEQREAYVMQRRLFEETPAAVGTDGSAGALAQADALERTLEAFTRQPGAVWEAGTLREIVCEAQRVTLLADTPRGRVRLDVEDPMNLMVLRGTRRVRELDLVCGPRPAEAAQFGYLLQGEGTEIRALLRILRFDRKP